MKCPGTTVRKNYDSIRYRGEPVEALYRYDAEVDRWTLTSPNVPPLVMEGDSIEEIERELPDVVEKIFDFERRDGRPDAGKPESHGAHRGRRSGR